MVSVRLRVVGDEWWGGIGGDGVGRAWLLQHVGQSCCRELSAITSNGGFPRHVERVDLKGEAGELTF